MKKLIIFLPIILLCFSGCISENNTTSIPPAKIINNEPQDIRITGDNIERTINYLDSPVNLRIVGDNNHITVSVTTKLVGVWITGDNNILEVSKNHSFIPVIIGDNDQINYYD